MVLAAYLGLAVVMSMPLVLNFSQGVVGQGGDPWQTMWRFEEKEVQLQEAISGGVQNFKTFAQNEFFGGGEPRLINLSVWPWMLLQVLFGQPMTYNLVWLLSYILSGYGMYLLVAYLLNSRKDSSLETQGWITQGASFLAGMYYMFLPFHVAHSMGHFGAMQTQWIPFIILIFLSFIRRPNLVKALIFSVLLTVQAWTEHHYALWLIFFFIVWAWLDRKKVKEYWKKERAVMYKGLIVGFLLLFVIMPYSLTARMALQQDSSLSLGKEQVIRFSADLFSYVVPAYWHPMWGGVFHQLFTEHFTGNVVEATQYLGVSILLLILFFHQKIPKKQKRYWLIIAGVFLVISLGPRLHIFGKVLPFWLPYDLIDSWPIINVVRAVARAGVFVGVATAVLLGWVVQTQFNRRVSMGAVGALIILEFLFLPVPWQSTQLSSAYEIIRESSNKAIIEIPAATNYVAASKALFASGFHEKEVVGSIALERALDEGVLKEVRSLPALRQLLYLRTGHLKEGRDDFFAQNMSETMRDVLRWLDVGAVVVNTDSLSTIQREEVSEFLESELDLRLQKHGDVNLYLVDSTKIKGDGVFMSRDGRWKNVGFDPVRDSIFAEIEKEASVSLYNVTNDEIKAILEFIIAPESNGNILVKNNNVVVADLLARGGSDIKIEVILSPGVTKLDFVNRLTDKVIIQDPVMKIQTVSD
jgi:hypothetical protein